MDAVLTLGRADTDFGDEIKKLETPSYMKKPRGNLEAVRFSVDLLSMLIVNFFGMEIWFSTFVLVLKLI